MNSKWLTASVLGLLALLAIARTPLRSVYALGAVFVLGITGWLLIRRSRRRVKPNEPSSPETRSQTLSTQLVALDARLTQGERFIHETRRVRGETQVELSNEKRPAVIEVLVENIRRYDSLVESQERYHSAIKALRDVARERIDIYREKQRLYKLVQQATGASQDQGLHDTTGVCPEELATEIDALDREIMLLAEKIDKLTDAVEATAEIEALVQSYRP